MRYLSLIAIFIFGLVFLTLRFILSNFKSNNNKFFTKAIKILGNQTIFYFIILAIIFTIYTFELLDSIEINWQYMLSALLVFGISWIVFCIIIIIFSILIVRKWTELEKDAKSFSKL